MSGIFKTLAFRLRCVETTQGVALACQKPNAFDWLQTLSNERAATIRTHFIGPLSILLRILTRFLVFFLLLLVLQISSRGFCRTSALKRAKIIESKKHTYLPPLSLFFSAVCAIDLFFFVCLLLAHGEREQFALFGCNINETITSKTRK